MPKNEWDKPKNRETGSKGQRLANAETGQDIAGHAQNLGKTYFNEFIEDARYDVGKDRVSARNSEGQLSLIQPLAAQYLSKSDPKFGHDKKTQETSIAASSFVKLCDGLDIEQTLVPPARVDEIRKARAAASQPENNPSNVQVTSAPEQSHKRTS